MGLLHFTVIHLYLIVDPAGEFGGGVASALITRLDNPLLRGPVIARGALRETNITFNMDVLMSTESCTRSRVRGQENSWPVTHN